MTDPMELVGRLENGSDRFLKWAYKEPYSGAPVISIPRHPDNIDALLTEAAACIREMVAFVPAISLDGQNRPAEHRVWLARQLLDSKLTDAEVYSIVRYSPAIKDTTHDR